MIVWRSTAALVFLILPTFVLSQEPLRISSLPSDTARRSTLQFSRSLETFWWNGRLGYDTRVEGVSVRFDQVLRSRLIRSAQNAIQDELGARLRVQAPVTNSWEIMGEARSSVLSDNRQLDLGNLSSHSLLAGPGSRLAPGIEGMVLGGYALASQEQVRDRGFSYEAGLTGRDVALSGFALAFDARSGRSFLTPRRIGADEVTLSAVRRYGESTSNALHAGYVRQQREFYTDADADIQADYGKAHNIFRRIESSVNIADTIEVRSGDGAILVHVGYGNRSIERGYRYKSFSNPAGVLLDTRIDETRLFGGFVGETDLTRWLHAGVRIDVEEREETHTVISRDDVPIQTIQRQERSARRLSNVSRRSVVGLNLGADLTARDRLNFSGSAGILRYDTPDTVNTDDRDELLLVGAVELIHRFQSGLVFSILADVTLSHLVYLSRFQSANNNWNRIFRLRPRAEYRPAAWFHTVNTAEVLANYTVYDFEEQVASVRSFSFRQASWSDSTSIRVGSRIEFVMLASVRLFERGILKWREFKERPENFFIEESYWPQVMVSVLDHLQLGVGYRYFSQARFRYDGRRRVFEQKLVNRGPTVRLQWEGRGSETLAIEGWRETQEGGGSERSFSNLSMVIGIRL